MNDVDLLKQRLAQIDARIEETRQRLPAHSVKPAMMALLFDLEDEREALLQALAAARPQKERPTAGRAAPDGKE